jgi:hypothetical protein
LERHSVSLALFVLDPGAWHADRFGAKGAHELALAVSVAVTLLRGTAPTIATATDEGRKFLLEQRLDGRPDVLS